MKLVLIVVFLMATSAMANEFNVLDYLKDMVGFEVMDYINVESITSFVKQIKKFFSYGNYTDNFLKDNGFLYSSVQNDQLLMSIVNAKLNLEQRKQQEEIELLHRHDMDQEHQFFVKVEELLKQSLEDRQLLEVIALSSAIVAMSSTLRLMYHAFTHIVNFIRKFRGNKTPNRLTGRDAEAVLELFELLSKKKDEANP